jgi:D-lyxose ketol-isomerase
MGLLLFTIRNGDVKDPESKQYAEKIMMVDVDQITPMHFHWHKAEDIINRGGGQLVIQLFNSTPDETLEDTPVTISTDGVLRTVKAGDCVMLGPGESITLPAYCYHKFWGAEGKVLVGEVSAVNDDDTDNRFLDPLPRYSQIEEDEPPVYLLCTDYPTTITLNPRPTGPCDLDASMAAHRLVWAMIPSRRAIAASLSGHHPMSTPSSRVFNANFRPGHMPAGATFYRRPVRIPGWPCTAWACPCA